MSRSSDQILSLATVERGAARLAVGLMWAVYVGGALVNLIWLTLELSGMPVSEPQVWLTLAFLFITVTALVVMRAGSYRLPFLITSLCAILFGAIIPQLNSPLSNIGVIPYLAMPVIAAALVLGMVETTVLAIVASAGAVGTLVSYPQQAGEALTIPFAVFIVAALIFGHQRTVRDRAMRQRAATLEETLVHALDSSDAGVFTLDAEGRHTSMFGGEALGITPEVRRQIIGRTAREAYALHGNEPPPGTEECIERARRHGNAAFEWQLGERHILTTITHRQSHADSPYAFFGVNVDVSERHRAAQELALAFDAIRGGTLTFDTRTWTVRLSERLLGHLALPRRWAERAFPLDAVSHFVHRGEVTRLNAFVDVFFGGGVQIFSFPLRLRPRRSGPEWMQVHCRRLAPPNSHVILAVAYDLATVGEYLETAREESRVQVRESHHRTKNDLALLRSVISLAMHRETIAEDARTLATDLLTRVDALAAVHDQLYHADVVGHVSLAAYLSRLVATLREAVPSRVRLDLHAPVEVNLPGKRVGTIGLIVGEWVVNACKYAFPADRSGRIRVAAAVDDGVLTVSVSDDGVGVEDTEILRTGDSFGTQVVQALAQQVHGGIRYECNPGSGVRGELAIPIEVLARAT